MQRLAALKYLSTLILPLLVGLAFWQGSYWTFVPVVYAYGLIPLAELLFAPDPRNLSQAEESLRKEDPLYDWMVYLLLGVHVSMLVIFLMIIDAPQWQLYEQIGLTISMGLMCGTYGINLGHELGHRKKPYERFLAKLALLSSLYMHFYIEHNRGHHKRVSTDADPASARYGETVYAFWLRSIWGSYWSAWRLESERLTRRQLPVFSWHNEMLRFQVIQLLLLLGISWFLGPIALLAFGVAAFDGIIALETVNYIEHYGLRRKALENGRYERVAPHHSWNSDHILGRLMLFELSRHSDHHYLASRKYQILRHHEETPQMPTGYPGMMIMALIPPLWFRVMHPPLQKWTQTLA